MVLPEARAGHLKEAELLGKRDSFLLLLLPLLGLRASPGPASGHHQVPSSQERNKQPCGAQTLTSLQELAYLPGACHSGERPEVLLGAATQLRVPVPAVTGLGPKLTQL